jgi:hypothetical protein
MTSATPLRAPSSSPTSAAEVFSLSEPICCVVQLAHQHPGVVHQVVLDPAKIRGELIRIGEWPGDEARGWQVIGNVAVLAVLGRATLSEDGKTVTVTPIIERGE